jgi:putative RecB family exonuclease
VRYRATKQHKRNAMQAIAKLAVQLRQDQTWQQTPGSHCGRCSFSRYCEAVNRDPVALPTTEPVRGLQLAFSL